MTKLWRLLMITLLLCGGAPAAWGQTVQLLFYHREPPFMLAADESKRAGLSFDLAALLNRQETESPRRFTATPLPRRRLGAELAPWIRHRCPVEQKSGSCDSNWILLWVTPQWGWGDEPEQHFLWVDLFRDEDLIISRAQHPVDYREPGDLIGLRFAAVRGHHLPADIEALMRSGKITRDDGNYERSLLQRLALNHADVTLLQRSSLNYLLNFDPEFVGLRGRFHVAQRPLQGFMLQAMIPANRPDLQALLLEVRQSKDWSVLMERYGIRP